MVTNTSSSIDFLSDRKSYVSISNVICYNVVQVWRVNGNKKNLLSASEQSKFYSGDCYIFQYSYPGEDKEDHLIGTWFGKQSIEVSVYRFLMLAV